MSTKTDNYHHGNLRQAMLSAAADILAEDGLQGLTLRACARKAGVSHAAPAHHFKGLTGLRSAIAAESFHMIASVAENVFADFDGGAQSLLQKFALAYSVFAKDNPERFRLMFRRDLLDTDDQGLCDAEERAYSTFVNIVHAVRGEAARPLEDFREGRLSRETYIDVSLYWSVIHGFAHLNIEHQFVGYGEIIGSTDFEKDVLSDIAGRIVPHENEKN